jgi:hypothetical protein
MNKMIAIRNCTLGSVNRLPAEVFYSRREYNRVKSTKFPSFARQPSALVSQSLRPSYLTHVTAAATFTDRYWHVHPSDCRNTLIYAHSTSRTLPTCDARLGSLTLPAPEAGDFVKLILLYVCFYVMLISARYWWIANYLKAFFGIHT